MTALLAIACLVAAAACLRMALRLRPQRPPAANACVAQPPRSTRTDAAPVGRDVPGHPGWLRVLPAHALLQCVGADETLAHLLRQSRLAEPVWRRDVLPAIHRYAEFVQLMPASESHHHAHAGGLLTHTLETMLAAATWRNGRLLPQGAQAEEVDRQRDYWTYVVLFAALLHDAGKPLADLRIDWTRAGSSEALQWMPAAGSLVDCQAEQYRVGFTPKAQRNYGLHTRFAVTLLQRLIPAPALSFLARQPQALQALMQYLAGEDSDGVIAEIIGRADRASTGRSLAQGSHARFPTASSVPLIELLMGALRDMLRRGGQMPLNRDGAVGWVYDGSVWFVAKRVADLVREYLRQHAPDEAVPGEAKNDRLFDTWQEYGCVMVNPATQQAIWYVVVHGEDGAGYDHQLSMLRFPLEKVWEDPAQRPSAMQGRIEILARRERAERRSEGEDPELGDEGSRSNAGHREVPDVGNAPGGPAPATDISIEIRAPSFRSATRVPPGGAREASTSGAKISQERPIDSDLLDHEESAAAEARRANRAAVPKRVVGTPSEGPETTPQSDPVVLRSPLPALAGDTNRIASDTALNFMRWLQHGLASGSIKYNEAGAPVHFVESGMALVSPLIFREFARTRPGDAQEIVPPERLGLDVQREVLKAGWHIEAAGGTNIHQFSVKKRGGARGGRLAAVVLADPGRWVVPVPPSNPAVMPSTADGAARSD